MDAIFIPAQVELPRPDGGAAGGRDPRDRLPERRRGQDARDRCPASSRARCPRVSTAWWSRISPSPGFLQQLIVDAGLSDELVYRITKLWWEKIKDIHEIAPGLDQANVKMAMEHATIPFHPGAIRYYKEIGVAR